MATAVHFQTNLNEGAATHKHLANEQRIKSKFESIKQSSSSQATAGIVRKKRLDVNTINSVQPEPETELAKDDAAINAKSLRGDVGAAKPDTSAVDKEHPL